MNSIEKMPKPENIFDKIAACGKKYNLTTTRFMEVIN